MTKRKRKSPEKTPARSRLLGLVLAAGGALWRLALRYPRLVGGVATFGVVFGTVAANALWYQPGQHPSPFLRTRDAGDFTALAGAQKSTLLTEHDPANVTTFRIEREGEGAEALPAAADQTAEVIRRVQAALIARGLYDGEPDGVIGPRTETAIALFQKSAGMEANGLVSPELMAALELETGFTAAVPAQRPSDLTGLEADTDPVAAAIRKAQTTIVTNPPRRPVTAEPKSAAEPRSAAEPKPAAAVQPAAVTAPAETKPSTALVAAPVPPRAVTGEASAPAQTPPISQASYDPGLVMEIQRGLSNMAYKDVTIDGMPGEETRTAIRRFERHYQLPITGEPSQAVLKKLRDIGAL
ncbi:peptidoglycan-binding domain-containing protein [Rhizobium sp. AAP43]|uniref:peptidoglycan-binding domain-containing protein n=1 Tax=Rhizobium sp. AAP43 TaxID=1523420 RepID=UPI0006B95C22|nr:peptidoglycan-binding domain-containing protein [Rhizobium sp. AAP43]KPF42274.1 peptidoglycan-binding protein [Rhizobium sp. AAP43]